MFDVYAVRCMHSVVCLRWKAMSEDAKKPYVETAQRKVLAKYEDTWDEKHAVRMLKELATLVNEQVPFCHLFVRN